MGERRRKIKKEEQQRKQREAKAEEEKEAEMERQSKKNNHEWDVNCKGNGMKVNGKIVIINGTNGSIWIEGIVAEGSHEWKFKIINGSGVHIGITNEKNEKKKDSYLGTLYYYTGGLLYDADGNLTKTNAKAKKNDIVSMMLDLKKNLLQFLLNGKQIGNAMPVKNGSYRAAISLYYSDDSVELLSN